MSSNLPSYYKKSFIEKSSEYIERIKQQSSYVYKQRFEYEQQISLPPILGHSFNGGGSSDISPQANLRTIAGGYQFYESGGTLEQILPPSAFAPILTVSLSVYQMGIFLCSWDPHPNSTTYTIDIYEDSFSGSPIYTYSPVSGTTFYTSGEFLIQNGHSYGASVKGVDEAASGAVFSSSLLLYSFTATVSIQQVGSLYCFWDARPGYTSFTVEFYETSFSAPPVYTASSVVGTTFSTTGEFPLVSGNSYGISVRGDAEDPSGAAVSSLLLYSFTATVSEPTNGSLHIVWNAHPGVSTYTVRIDQDTSGNTVWTYNTVSGTSLDTTGEFTLVDGTAYSAVVTGTGLGASASVTSPFFTYIEGGGGPTLTATVAIQSVGSLGLSWDPHPEYSTYTIIVYEDTSGTLIHTYTAVSGTSLNTLFADVPLVGGRSYGISVLGTSESTGKRIYSSFTSYPIYTVTISEPANEYLRIVWNAHPGVSTYTVRIDQDTSGNTVWTYSSVSGTLLNTTGEFALQVDHTYSAVVTGTGLGPTASVKSPFFTYRINLYMIHLIAANYSGSGPWLDESGNGFHATLASGIAAKNNVGNGIILNGSTYWTFPNISAGPYWTILLWYKKIGESIPPDQYADILTQVPSNVINLMIGNVGSADIKAGFYNSSVNEYFLTSSPIPFELGVWNNVAVTYDGSSLLTYKSGTLIDTQVINLPSVDSGDIYRIGRRWDVADYVVGEIGELRIYSNVQSASAIQSFYTNTFGNYVLLASIRQSVYNSLHLVWDSHLGSTTYTVTLYKNPSEVLIYTYTGVTGFTLDTGVEVSILNDTLYRFSVVGDASGDSTVFSSDFLSNTLYPSLSLNPSYTTLELSWNPAVGATPPVTYVIQLYRAITSATVLSIYTTLLQTYTAVSGTSLTTGGEITVSDAKYYFTRVKVTGQADSSYKTVVSSLFVWGGGTNLGLTLVNRPNGFRASWTAASGVYQGYTVSMYAAADSTFITSVDAGSNLTCDLSSGLFEIGSSYYAAITLTNIPQSTPLLSPSIVYNPLVLSLQATNYSGTGTWADESSYGNNATPDNGTPSLNGDGNGIVFDGSVSFVCPDFGDLPRWSIVTWFKRTGNLPVASAILTQFMDGGNMRLYSENGDQPAPTQLCGGMASYQGYAGTLVTFPLNEWHQMTVTWDGATMKSYFDGSVYATQSFPNVVTTTNGYSYIIGRSWFLQNFIVGEIGALRVYGAALPASSIQTYYTNTSGTYVSPLLLLRASSYSGSGTWLDESGNGNNANVDASGTPVVNGDGNGIVLDGSTYWTFPNVAAGNSWTVGVWFKQTAPPTGNGASIVTQESSNSTVNLSIGYHWNSTTTFSGSFQSTGWAYGSPITVTTGEWISIYVTWDGTNMRTYVNGSLTGTTQPGYTSIDSGLVYTIGKAAESANYMNSEIGEVRIYGLPLSSTQIAGYFSATRSTFGV